MERKIISDLPQLPLDQRSEGWGSKLAPATERLLKGSDRVGEVRSLWVTRFVLLNQGSQTI